VSAPCTWDELERGVVNPDSFTLRTMPARVKELGDVWSDLLRRKRSLTRPLARVRALLST